MGVWRCAMLTAMQCGTYDRAKEAAGHLLGTSQTDVGTHFAPSLASGIASTTATVPFDNVKTIQIVQRLPTALEGARGGRKSVRCLSPLRLLQQYLIVLKRRRNTPPGVV